MKKIRIGNDFVLLWKVERNGKIEPLSEAIDLELFYYVYGEERPVTYELVGTNTIRVEITPEIADKTGEYRFELAFIYDDLSATDKDQKNRTDVMGFTIVDRDAKADDLEEVNVTSDLLIGFRGRKFVSEDFTEAEWDDLQSPAIQASLIAKASALNADEKAETAHQATQVLNQKTQEVVENLTRWENEVADNLEQNNTSVDTKLREVDDKITEIDSSILETGRKIEEVNTQMQGVDTTMSAIVQDNETWRSEEQQRKEAEILRVERDAERITSIEGTIEYNEINII